MNNMRHVLVVVVLVVLAACDPAYPLFLRNGLATPITVRATFEEGAPSEGVLRPGERLTFLHPKGEIKYIVILSEGQKLHELDKKALLDMRNSIPNPRLVTWNIQSDGIKPLSQLEAEKLEKSH